jgi:tetratricopeptide (TPR) repeat protein
MIVKNEERFLEQCLRSVTGIVDEICIVDTGSTDRTVEIAKQFGARVEHREWRNDFGWARNEALKMATRRWIMMLDADEELKPESAPALQALKHAPADTTGVWLRCYNKSDDYRGTGEMSHALVRIFPNSPRVAFRGMIHEFVTLDGRSTGLGAVHAPISIVHHGYLKEVVESRDKAQRNLQIVQAAAHADPDDPFNWFNLGTTSFMMKDYEGARAALEKMRELNGDSPRGFIANGYAVLAETYCDKLNDPKSGEDVSRGALRFSPHYANAHFQLGKALIAQQRFDEARSAFNDAIEDGKYSHLQFVVDDQVAIWKAHSEIGSSFVLQGDDRSAIEWFRKGLANAPTVQPLMLNLARALERLGQFDEAHELFNRVYEEFRDDYGTVDYVNYLLRRKQGAEALCVIDASHGALGDVVAAQLLLAAAQIVVKLRDMDAAVPYLEKAAERAPGQADILNWLEAAYREKGDETAIQRLLEREATIEPQSTAEFLRRVYHANVAGNYVQALEFAARGLTVEPANEPIRYAAAVAASALGAADEALAHLQFVVTPSSDVYPAGLILRANVYRSLARSDDAAAAVEALLANHPSHVEALRLKASLAEERSDLTRAEDAFRAIATADPNGVVDLAGFLLRHGRFEEAARVADAALQR